MSLAIRTWFRVANLASTLWIPAFAGMTGWRRGSGFADCDSCLISGGGLGSPPPRASATLWIPAFAGMTGWKAGIDGGGKRCRQRAGRLIGSSRVLKAEIRLERTIIAPSFLVSLHPLRHRAFAINLWRFHIGDYAEKTLSFAPALHPVRAAL